MYVFTSVIMSVHHYNKLILCKQQLLRCVFSVSNHAGASYLLNLLHDYIYFAGPSSSLLGTQAKCAEEGYSMHLNLGSGDDHYKEFVIIHEFGHALGLGHEHQTSLFASMLDKDATIEWLTKSPCNLPHPDAKKKFDDDFQAFSGVDIPEHVGKLDVKSIMCYP